MEAYDGWTEQGKRNCAAYIAKMLNRSFSSGDFAHFAGADGEPQEKRDAAIRDFLDTLRGLVDQWIDSGKDEMDVRIEEPWKRDIHRQSEGYPEPIVTALMAYRDRNHPRVIIRSDGRFSVQVGPASTEQTNILLRARDRAIFWFVMLLDSPTRERLSRCEACRAYFVRARAPKKDMRIFRGTFCSNPNCRGKGSLKRMDATRENRTKRRVELAAKLWPEWRQRKGQPNRSKWVAREMNNTLFIGDQGITGKWVTQHQKEVEAEVERRKHA